MGAWGEKGFDNDTSMDWFDGISSTIKFILQQAFWSRWQEEGVAAAQLLTELPPRLQEELGVHVFSEALEIVDSELKPEAIEPWKHPMKRHKYLTKLLATLTRRHGQFPKSRRGRRIIIRKRK